MFTKTTGKTALASEAVGRLVIVAVWLHNGLWHKLIAVSPRHTAVVASVPGVQERWASIITTGIGVVECIFAIGVLLGCQRWFLAALQITCLMAMTFGGIIWAGEQIIDPAGMVMNNLVFAALIISVVQLGELRALRLELS